MELSWKVVFCCFLGHVSSVGSDTRVQAALVHRSPVLWQQGCPATFCMCSRILRLAFSRGS